MTSLVPLRAGGPIIGIVPQTVEEIFRLATGIAKSGLAPKDMATPEKVMVAIMTGLELGLPPMFAVQKIAVINGRPALWGDAVPALLWGRGFKLREWLEGAGDTLTALCEVTRPTGESVTRSFSVDDAKAAGLWAKAGPWKQYPSRMLQMRARGFAARDGAADVLAGIYLREELEERDITPPKASPIEIPDLDDTPSAEPPTSNEAVSAASEHEPDDPPLTDEQGWLAKLEEDRSLVDSEEELADLVEVNADRIARLSPAGRASAEAILRIEE